MDSIEHGSYTHDGKRRTERVNTQQEAWAFTTHGMRGVDALTQEQEVG